MDWIEAHNELETNLAAISGIKHVDFYNEQPYYEEEEYPYPLPAIFLDWSSSNIETFGKHSQNLNMNVQVILQTATLADSHKGSDNKANAINFAALLTEVHKVLQGSEGDNHSETNRISLSRLEAPRAYVQLWQQTYSLSVADNSAIPTDTLNENDTNKVAVSKP